MLFPFDTEYNSRDLHSNMDMQLFSIKVFMYVCVVFSSYFKQRGEGK